MNIVDQLMQIGGFEPESRRDIEYSLALALSSKDSRDRINWRRHFPWLTPRMSAMQQNRCCWCDSEMAETVDSSPSSRRGREFETDPLRPTLDHIVPLADGGEDEPDNLSVACFRCNSGRRDKPVMRLRQAA